MVSDRFNSCLYGVCERIRGVLVRLPAPLKGKTEEIRLRTGLPVCLTVGGRPMFVTNSGEASEYITRDLLLAERKDLEESFKLLCRNSVYAHETEIENGFIMMNSGHRAGICGTVTSSGAIRDISSLNIRIAREVFGVANPIVKSYGGGGVLIAGPPGSGKTTVLRDLIRQLSEGISGRYYRVVAIDSRGELSGSFEGESYNDLGKNTDVLLCSDKSMGLQMAVRTMFPDIVAFDEIGTSSELKGVSDGLNAGVAVITTAHIGSVQDLMRRSVTLGLLRSGAISDIAVLSRAGGEIELLSCAELLYEYGA